ncbi:uncharacterized protein LOC131857675 [Cryptomeria japonica]|uniref:uncharacterized protein LOC131857675 n=1 Tax=Cryptomeria japonica TaxID=3369 RepID=UPI0027D9D7CA|nr:uncharacterized protein LOC131857675 [Cryptomeria japonica]
MGEERQGEWKARNSNFKHGDGNLSAVGAGNQTRPRESQVNEGDKVTVKSMEDKDSKNGDPHDRGHWAKSCPLKKGKSGKIDSNLKRKWKMKGKNDVPPSEVVREKEATKMENKEKKDVNANNNKSACGRVDEFSYDNASASSNNKENEEDFNEAQDYNILETEALLLLTNGSPQQTVNMILKSQCNTPPKSLDMVVLEGNLRIFGMNAPHKQDVLRNIVRDHKPDVVLIQETKMCKNKVESIRIFKSNGVIGTSLKGASGGTTIFWNQNTILGKEIASSVSRTSILLEHIKDNSVWVITNIYVPNSKAGRIKFWRSMAEDRLRFEKAWLSHPSLEACVDKWWNSEAIQENKRLSVSPGKGKRKMEEGGPSKEELSQTKKSKKDTVEKIQEDMGKQKETEVHSKDLEKEGSEMETDEFDGEERWKEEEMGEEEGGAEDVSDQDSPTHSDKLNNEERDLETEQEKEKENSSREQDKSGEGIILDKLKNQSEARMGFDRWIYERIKYLEKIDKQQEEKGKNVESNQEQWQKGMEEKVEKMEAQISNLEEGKNAMKNLLGMILDILSTSTLSSMTMNLEEIAKFIEGSSTSKPVVDLNIDEDATEAGTVESAPSGVAKEPGRA